MRNLLIALIITLSVPVFGQEYVITIDTLRDKDNLENSFLTLDMEGRSPQSLYDVSVEYLENELKISEDAILEQVEGQYLKYESSYSHLLTYERGDWTFKLGATFITELTFEGDQVVHKISDIVILCDDCNFEIVLAGKGITSVYLYKEKNGKVRQKELKEGFEESFNTIVKNYIKYLEEE